MFVVQQGFYVSSTKKILTGDVQTCVAFTLFNPVTLVGGMAHVGGSNIVFIVDQFNAPNGLDDYISAVAKDTPLEQLQATLLSGSASNMNILKSYLEDAGFKNIKVHYGPKWTEAYQPENIQACIKKQSSCQPIEGGNIAIDCKNGKLYSVRPDYDFEMAIENTPRPQKGGTPMKQADAS